MLRTEKELVATVHRPAEAEKYKLETLAEGRRTQAVFKAVGEAEGIKLIGSAEAASIRAIGEAEAMAMRAKADAYKNYGEAAVMSLILESLPRIAAEVAAPLGQVKDIVILGNSSSDNITNDITKLVSSLPPAVQAITGVDISNVSGEVLPIPVTFSFCFSSCVYTFLSTKCPRFHVLMTNWLRHGL